MRAAARARSALVLLALGLAVTMTPTDAHAEATFVIVNLDGPGEGFNETTPWTPTGGNPATTVGQARLNAFQYAADIWGSLLESNVPIRVQAAMDPLYCAPTSAVLGAAGPTSAHENFSAAPFANTWYPPALANALQGADLNPTGNDIQAQFNSSLNGDAGCLGGHGWYYGFDGNPPPGDYDFVTVVLHELGHGLGFLTYCNLATGDKFYGHDDAYMRHLDRLGATPSAYNLMTDPQRVAANISDPDLRWTGGHTTYMLPGAGVSSGLSGDYIRMHAPNPLVQGSSVAHFSTAVFPNEIMEPIFTGPTHDPGLALHLLHDIGWPLDANVGVAFPRVTATAVFGGVMVAWSYAGDESATGFRVYRTGDDRPGEDLVSGPGLLPADAVRFLDPSAAPGVTCRYAVAAVTAGGGEIRSAQAVVTTPLLQTALAANAPNPFNPSTELRFTLAQDGPVRLDVHDLAGRLVRTLVDEPLNAGGHTTRWDGRDDKGRMAAAGVYVARLQSADAVRSRRMVMLK